MRRGWDLRRCRRCSPSVGWTEACPGSGRAGQKAGGALLRMPGEERGGGGHGSAPGPTVENRGAAQCEGATRVWRTGSPQSPTAPGCHCAVLRGDMPASLSGLLAVLGTPRTGSPNTPSAANRGQPSPPSRRRWGPQHPPSLLCSFHPGVLRHQDLDGQEGREPHSPLLPPPHTHHISHTHPELCSQ